MSKIVAGVLPVLFLMTVLSAPLVSADSDSFSSCSSDGSCPAAENVEDLEVMVENLDGFEEKRAVVDAWKNRDTRLLMKELIWKEHCTPRIPKSEAQDVTLYGNGEVFTESTKVKIPFKAHGRGLDAQIIWRDNGTSERVSATVAGSTSALEEPMEILKENARYQAIVENLEGRGYEVKERNAEVVKTYTPADYEMVPAAIEERVWKTAVINVKAVRENQVKNITALVCINKGKVLVVTDFWCELGCHTACGVGCAAACTFLGVSTIVLAGLVFECFEVCHIFGCLSFCDWACDEL